MLALRRETEYAVQFLRLLSKHKNGLSLNDVSEKIGVSFLFLQKIARKLRQAEIVGAEKGASGGYKLLVSPRKLSLRQILEITEGKFCLLPCLGKKDFACAHEKGCSLKNKTGKINKAMIDLAEKIKLSDL